MMTYRGVTALTRYCEAPRGTKHRFDIFVLLKKITAVARNSVIRSQAQNKKLPENKKAMAFGLSKKDEIARLPPDVNKILFVKFVLLFDCSCSEGDVHARDISSHISSCSVAQEFALQDISRRVI